MVTHNSGLTYKRGLMINVKEISLNDVAAFNIDFPANPVDGQVLSFNDQSWKYRASSASWILLSGVGPTGDKGDPASNLGYARIRHTGAGTVTVFSRPSNGSADVENHFIAIDGILQEPVEDFTITTTNVVFDTAPPLGSRIVIRSLRIS